MLQKILLELFWFCLAACLVGPPEPPARPESVPPEAVWAGGSDGGAWILCEVDESRDVNPCSTYNDFTGEVWFAGDFLLWEERRAARLDELLFAGFDGQCIYLRSGQILIRTDKIAEREAFERTRKP